MSDSSNSTAIYLLRTVQQHHVQLSVMADQKANFLLAASFVTLSILIGYGATHRITASLISIGLFTITASIFAILTIMPSYKLNDRRNIQTNPLFFGDFAQESVENYLNRMTPVLESDAKIFELMLRDIHSMGKVLLKKKYRYLSWSYRIFLVGLVVSPLIWIVEKLT